jgi:hypothetical protein
LGGFGALLPQEVVVRLRNVEAARRRACAQSNLPRSSGGLRYSGCVGVRVVALLGRQELLHALEELDQELGRLNVRGEVLTIHSKRCPQRVPSNRADSLLSSWLRCSISIGTFLFLQS